MSFNPHHIVEDVIGFARTLGGAMATRRPGRGVDHAAIPYQADVTRAVEAIHPRRMALQVAEVIHESTSTHTLRFQRTDGPIPPFRAGQYLSLAVQVGPVHTNRPYSISSPPGVPHLDVTLRDYPEGFVSHHLCSTVQVGQVFVSSGPQGQFYHEPLRDGDDLVFLAGGCGITPFMSLLRHEQALGWPRKVSLIYGNRGADDVPFGTELRRMNIKNPQFTLRFVMSEPAPGHRGRVGFLTGELIQEVLGSLDGHTFFLCGPAAMARLVVPDLLARGVLPRHIRQERFGAPPQLAAEPGWDPSVGMDQRFRITLQGVGEFVGLAGEPLLVSLERAGHPLRSTCRTGQCADCRVRLLEGQVFMPAAVGLRQADRERGYIHACSSYPQSDLTLRR